MLSFFVTEILPAIFDFNGRGRLGKEINLYYGGGRRSKKINEKINKERDRVGEGRLRLPKVIVILQNSDWCG